VITHYASADVVPDELPAGVALVAAAEPGAVAAALAQRFGATIATDVGVARRAVAAGVEARAAEREARCRLVAARVEAAIAATALPSTVVAAGPGGMRARAAAVTLSEQAAADAEAAVGAPPPYDAAAVVAVDRMAAGVAGAEACRAARRRRFLSGLARGNGVAAGLLGVVVVSSGLSDAAFTSSATATTLVGMATAAPFVGVGVAVGRFLSARRREDAARDNLARALERARASSPTELAVHRAAHDAWRASRAAADRAREVATGARHEWQQFVGSARRADVERWLAATDAVRIAEVAHARALEARTIAEHEPALVVMGDGNGRVAKAVAKAGRGRPVIVVAPEAITQPVPLPARRRLARFARRRAS